MYDYIIGTVAAIKNNAIVLENNGIGYLIYVSNPYSFEENREYKVYVYQQVKEDEQLYFQFKKYILLEKFSKEVANINDEDILSAIKCHTTGKPNMNLLEKIVYVSDYIEPLRYKMPRLNVIRKIAFEDIDECLKLILTDTLNYLKSSGMMIDKATIDTYNYYCK